MRMRTFMSVKATGFVICGAKMKKNISFYYETKRFTTAFPKLATGPCTEPAESTPLSSDISTKIPFNIHFTSTPRPQTSTTGTVKVIRSRTVSLITFPYHPPLKALVSLSSSQNPRRKVCVTPSSHSVPQLAPRLRVFSTTHANCVGLHYQLRSGPFLGSQPIRAILTIDQANHFTVLGSQSLYTTTKEQLIMCKLPLTQYATIICCQCMCRINTQHCRHNVYRPGSLAVPNSDHRIVSGQRASEDTKINVHKMSREWQMIRRSGLDSSDSRVQWRTLCEYGNEPSRSKTVGEYPGHMRRSEITVPWR